MSAIITSISILLLLYVFPAHTHAIPAVTPRLTRTAPVVTQQVRIELSMELLVHALQAITTMEFQRALPVAILALPAPTERHALHAPRPTFALLLPVNAPAILATQTMVLDFA